MKTTKFEALGRALVEAMQDNDEEAPLAPGQGIEFEDEMGHRVMGTIVSMQDGRLNVRSDSDINHTIEPGQVVRVLPGEPEAQASLGSRSTLREKRIERRAVTRFAMGHAMQAGKSADL